ncbi:hypothetical protein [Mucilaginibacter sp.]|jgi:hypothetical protein|uniref:hypothetical protein n=1 Tax=Mucilaginibacter sp. TaxID=1882438 RepID=UPI0035654D07
MREILSADFLISIVWINEFNLLKNICNVNVLCIESDNEVVYSLNFTDILYTAYRQENIEDEFEVIETTLSKFNDSKTVNFMHSKSRQDYWIIEFISGLHTLTISFKTLTCIKA